MNRLEQVGKFLIDKSPAIFTGLAVAGVVETAVLAVKATPSALDEMEKVYLAKGEKEPLTKKEIIKATWKCYSWTLLSAGVTIGCIVAANKAHISKEAGIAAAAAWYKNHMKDYKQEMINEGSSELDQKIEKKLAEKQISKHEPLPYLKKWAEEDGKFLCYEPITDQYFLASKTELIWAELTANKMFQCQKAITLNQILKLFKGCISTKPIGERYGWSLDPDTYEYMAFNWGFYGTPWIDIRPEITAVDGQEYMVINFTVGPMRDEPNDLNKSQKLQTI